MSSSIALPRVARQPAPSQAPVCHQYLRRGDATVVTEQFFGDRIVRFLYGTARERARPLFDAVSSARFSRLLAGMNFDWPLARHLAGQSRFLRRCGVSLAECVDPPEFFDTPRKIFERRLRYWECRPMPDEPGAVVSPADAKVIVGSLQSNSMLSIKGKFFDLPELLGCNRSRWLKAFDGGDVAIFRLTPDKYHYNHVPVAGEVVDLYKIPGRYHACHPDAAVELVTPYSKNKRVVTILQTDTPDGAGVGLVAMIEVVALMIGDIVQRYSPVRYDDPQPIRPGMFLRKGAPKSLFRPGSSTVVLLFQPRRVTFAEDLARNRFHAGADSRFSAGFGMPLVETDVDVRSRIAGRREDLS